MIWLNSSDVVNSIMAAPTKGPVIEDALFTFLRATVGQRYVKMAERHLF